MEYLVGLFLLFGFIKLVRVLAGNPKTTAKVAGGIFKMLRK